MANKAVASIWTLVLAVGGLGAGCGGSHDGPPAATSGLPESDTLVTLTEAERGQLCDWVIAKVGSYGRPGTPGICPASSSAATSPFFRYVDQAACIADSASAARTPACEATVEVLEACVNALPHCPVASDLEAAPACAGLSNC